jgi:hypothetical protein
MKYLAQLAEKAIATYIEAFLTVLVVGSTLDTSTAQAAAIAAIPAALTIVANGLPAVPSSLPFWVDAALRTVRTFTATFLGYLIALPIFSLNTSVLIAAATAGIAAGLTVLKTAVASHIGEPETAAVLPKRFEYAA